MGCKMASVNAYFPRHRYETLESSPVLSCVLTVEGRIGLAYGQTDSRVVSESSVSTPDGLILYSVPIYMPVQHTA